MENQFTFKRDFKSLIVSNLILLALSAYFIASGFRIKPGFLQIFSFSVSAILILLLLSSLLVKPEISHDYKNIELKFLAKKKTVNIESILFYSRNIPNSKGLFCQSNDNICIYTEGKKICISIEESDELEKLLISRQVPFVNKKNTSAIVKRIIFYGIIDYIILLTLPIGYNTPNRMPSLILGMLSLLFQIVEMIQNTINRKRAGIQADKRGDEIQFPMKDYVKYRQENEDLYLSIKLPKKKSQSSKD